MNNSCSHITSSYCARRVYTWACEKAEVGVLGGSAALGEQMTFTSSLTSEQAGMWNQVALAQGFITCLRSSSEVGVPISQGGKHFCWIRMWPALYIFQAKLTFLLHATPAHTLESTFLKRCDGSSWLSSWVELTSTGNLRGIFSITSWYNRAWVASSLGRQT